MFNLSLQYCNIYLSQTSKPPIDPDELKRKALARGKDYLPRIMEEMSIEPEDIPFDPPRHPSGNGYQVPPGIRPILKNTRIEILSWGLRHLKFWAKKPIDNPLIEIECGGGLYTLPKIPDLVNLPNFPVTSHYFDVVRYSCIARVAGKRRSSRANTGGATCPNSCNKKMSV